MTDSKMYIFTVAVWMILQCNTISGFVMAQSTRSGESMLVKKCNDFNINGKGDNAEWNKTSWALLTKLDEGSEAYESKFKILYSAKGIYVLFNSKDDKITTKDYKDNENIFNDDVVEVFFHPDPQANIYFEYEVNQLDVELVLAISNLNGENHKSWIPWHNRSSIIKMVNVVGGDKKVNGKIQSWSAEIFFPYGVLGLIPKVPPVSGTIWNANFCRLDYDTGKMIKWSWSPSIKESFHDLQEFRSIRFE